MVRIPSCDTGLVEVAGTCRHPACGTEGSRPCSVFERLPSCDAGLIEMPFGVSCVHPNCGRLNQNACLVTERIPSCDGDLVESGGLCLSASPCELPESAVAVTPPSLQFQAPVTAKTRPQGLVATRVDTKVVRLTWQGDVGGTLSILRDGKLLANLAGNATSYEDPNVSQGWHEYLVKRVPASGPTQPAKVRIRLGPFNVVVLGDSVAWGQGLAEGHKFSNLVARALEAELGTPVRVVVTAHSGANVRPPVGWSLGDEERLTPGEMPNTYPTIQRQIDLAAARFAPNAPVDLVLVDGCINDLGVMTILNPTHSANKIQSDTSTVCGLPVVQLLQGVGTRFPSARIVMTGYFPMVSNASDLTAVGALLATVGVAAGAGSAALGIPVLNPTTGAIVGVGITEATHKLAAMNAQAFHVTSTRTLAQSARTANLSLGGRVSFACTPFSPANAYAAPQTWLWLAPTGGTTNDEVTLSRHQDCARDDYLALAGAPIGSMAPSRLNCMAASIGHPNLLGAKAYANAIQKEINPFLPYWKALFSAVQPKP